MAVLAGAEVAGEGRVNRKGGAEVGVPYRDGVLLTPAWSRLD